MSAKAFQRFILGLDPRISVMLGSSPSMTEPGLGHGLPAGLLLKRGRIS
jgi:hypothetical protein